MRVLGTNHLFDFSVKHPPTRSWIRTWLADVRQVGWANSHAIKAMYPAASFLPQNLVIFNVKGNEYRMVTQVAYRTQILVVKWIGTHDAYSKMNWESYKNETRSR